MPRNFAVRNHVDFDWRGTSVSTPPGRELALWVRGVLAAVGDMVHTFDMRAEYGWEFVVRIEGASLLVILQEVERWLIVVHPLGGLYALARWYRGGDREAALEKASRTLHGALVGDSGFGHIRWYTWDEFDRRFEDPRPGSPEPGRV